MKPLRLLPTLACLYPLATSADEWTPKKIAETYAVMEVYESDCAPLSTAYRHLADKLSHFLDQRELPPAMLMHGSGKDKWCAPTHATAGFEDSRSADEARIVQKMAYFLGYDMLCPDIPAEFQGKKFFEPLPRSVWSRLHDEMERSGIDGSDLMVKVKDYAVAGIKNGTFGPKPSSGESRGDALFYWCVGVGAGASSYGRGVHGPFDEVR